MGCKEFWKNVRDGLTTRTGICNALSFVVTAGATTILAIQCTENEEPLTSAVTAAALEGIAGVLSGLVILAGEKIERDARRFVPALSALITSAVFIMKGADLTRHAPHATSPLGIAASTVAGVAAVTSVATAVSGCYDCRKDSAPREERGSMVSGTGREYERLPLIHSDDESSDEENRARNPQHQPSK